VDAKLRLPCALASGDAADDMLGEMLIGAESLGEERVAAAFKRARKEDVWQCARECRMREGAT